MSEYSSNPYAIQAREWRRDNPEKSKAKNKKYYAQNKQKVREQANLSAKLRRRTNPEHIRQLDSEKRKRNNAYYKSKDQAYLKKLKLDVLNAYSNNDPKCACPGCPIKAMAFMTMDHVNNDGKAHRLLIGGSGNLYSYLRTHNYPTEPKLQVLCWNCNQGKRLNGGICPLYGKDHANY